MKKSEIKLTGLQIKSLSKLEKLSALLNIIEIEFGIREVRITLDDCFICPDIDLKALSDTPMNEVLKEIVNKLN